MSSYTHTNDDDDDKYTNKRSTGKIMYEYKATWLAGGQPGLHKTLT